MDNTKLKWIYIKQRFFDLNDDYNIKIKLKDDSSQFIIKNDTLSLSLFVQSCVKTLLNPLLRIKTIKQVNSEVSRISSANSGAFRLLTSKVIRYQTGGGFYRIFKR